MAYLPISGSMLQYMRNATETASGYYLKGYAAPGSTSLQMATDNTGATLLTKCTLNTDGNPISNALDQNSEFVPHFNQVYKLALYASEADADANINPVWEVNNLDPGITLSNSVDRLQERVIGLCQTVADMTDAGGPIVVVGNALTAAQLANMADEGCLLKTTWNNTTSKAGGAEYEIKTRAQHRTDIGDAGWEPDGYVDHYLLGGTTYVAILKIDGFVNVQQTGAVGDNSTDDRAAIQAAEDYARPRRLRVYFPSPSVGYRINAPLVAGTFSNWEGETEQIYIFKHGNTTSGLPTRLIPAGGGASDTMDVDAVLVIDHADNAYASYVNLKNLYFRNQTTNGTTVAYNIFSPRINYFRFQNVSTRGALTAAWRWHDAWQGQIDSMFVSDATRGFNGEPDGLASGSGTSLNFIRPYAFNCGVGYDIYGLAYSTFISPACDEPSSIGYYFETCNNLTITSLGIETVSTATYSLRFVQSYVTITGAKENNNNPTTAKVSLATGSRVSLTNVRFLDYAVAGSAANLELSGTSHLITENTVLPTNGTSFISYGAGSTWTQLKDGNIITTNSTSSCTIGPTTKVPAYTNFNVSATSSPGTPFAVATGLGRQPLGVDVNLTATTSDTLPTVIPKATLASSGGSIFVRFVDFTGAEVSGTHNIDIVAY